MTTLALTFCGVSATRKMAFMLVCPKCKTEREFKRYEHSQQRQAWTCQACGKRLLLDRWNHLPQVVYVAPPLSSMRCT